MDGQLEREQRGLVIAAKAKLQQVGDGRWFVPSQSGSGTFYTVKLDTANLIAVAQTLRHGSKRASTYTQ